MATEGRSKSKAATRRQFLKTGLAAATFPYIVPVSALGKGGAVPPSERIVLGCIGVGRMGQGDMREFMKLKDVHIAAVCDFDANRCKDAAEQVNRKYDSDCSMYRDFAELIAREDIDAVSIVTPDHWHAIPAIMAAKAGKDIFLQKPMTLTIEEGRAVSDAVREAKVVFQCGSQQRSEANFRVGCELALNGYLGEVKSLKVGLGTDPGCGIEPEMPVPKNLDYNGWLGQCPEAPYTEKRVHPEKGYDRPGWLRIKAYGHGMITGWGAHHLDIAHWGMGWMGTGPRTIEGTAVFPESGLWDVHGDFDLTYTYDNDVVMNVSSKHPNGVRFEGSEGWVYVTRGKIDASDSNLLDIEIKDSDTHLYKSTDHKANFLECIRTRKETVAPVENAHRSCTACILGSHAMDLGRKLFWDPKIERFANDDEANALLSRKMRAPWAL